MVCARPVADGAVLAWPTTTRPAPNSWLDHTGRASGVLAQPVHLSRFYAAGRTFHRALDQRIARGCTLSGAFRFTLGCRALARRLALERGGPRLLRPHPLGAGLFSAAPAGPPGRTPAYLASVRFAGRLASPAHSLLCRRRRPPYRLELPRPDKHKICRTLHEKSIRFARFIFSTCTISCIPYGPYVVGVAGGIRPRGT